MNNIRQAKARERDNKQKFLEVNPTLDGKSGIYILTREEDGIKYAYIGQAKHILTRLAQHLVGYQHIDLSLKKHGLHSDGNPCGWKVNAIHFKESELDEKEQYYIKLYANKGYQLRNKTSGSQGEGKRQIDEYRPQKGYRDGLSQGYKNSVNELKNIIDKHLVISLRPDKLNNKVSQKQFEKFNQIIGRNDEIQEGK